MIPIKTVRFIIVLLGTIVVFTRTCIAGTWIDDFSDRTLRDWGGEPMNDMYSAAAVDGHFNFRGKNQEANLGMTNWELGEIQDFSLELKFMVRNVRNPADSGWSVEYQAFNEETREWEGVGIFGFKYGHGVVVIPDVAFVSIIWRLPEHDPQIGRVVLGARFDALARFAYEKGVWYTLKIERQKIVRERNRYIFWIGDFGLMTEDDSLTSGSIGLHFVGRCNIWLDDLIVTGPDVPDGGPGVLNVNPLAEQVTTTWGRLKAQN